MKQKIVSSLLIAPIEGIMSIPYLINNVLLPFFIRVRVTLLFKFGTRGFLLGNISSIPIVLLFNENMLIQESRRIREANRIVPAIHIRIYSLD